MRDVHRFARNPETEAAGGGIESEGDPEAPARSGRGVPNVAEDGVHQADQPTSAFAAEDSRDSGGARLSVSSKHPPNRRGESLEALVSSYSMLWRSSRMSPADGRIALKAAISNGVRSGRQSARTSWFRLCPDPSSVTFVGDAGALVVSIGR